MRAGISKRDRQGRQEQSSCKEKREPALRPGQSPPNHRQNQQWGNPCESPRRTRRQCNGSAVQTAIGATTFAESLMSVSDRRRGGRQFCLAIRKQTEADVEQSGEDGDEDAANTFSGSRGAGTLRHDAGIDDFQPFPAISYGRLGLVPPCQSRVIDNSGAAAIASSRSNGPCAGRRAMSLLCHPLVTESNSLRSASTRAPIPATSRTSRSESCAGVACNCALSCAP